MGINVGNIAFAFATSKDIKNSKVLSYFSLE